MSTSDAPAAPSQVTAVRVVSSCGTIDSFVSLFSRLFDVDQMWILTPQVMPGGTRLAVLITLSDGEVALSFTGDVMKAFPTSAPTPYGRPGMLVRILSVPPASRPVMQRLHEASREFGQSTRVAVAGGDEEREPASLEDLEADVETVGAAEQEEVFGPGAAQEEIFSASFTARQRTTSDTLPQPLDMKMDPGMAPPPVVVAFTPVAEPAAAPAPAPVAESVPESVSVPEPAPAAPAPVASPRSNRPPWPVLISLVALAFLVGYWLG